MAYLEFGQVSFVVVGFGQVVVVRVILLLVLNCCGFDMLDITILLGHPSVDHTVTLNCHFAWFGHVYSQALTDLFKTKQKNSKQQTHKQKKPNYSPNSEYKSWRGKKKKNLSKERQADRARKTGKRNHSKEKKSAETNIVAVCQLIQK